MPETATGSSTEAPQPPANKLDGIVFPPSSAVERSTQMAGKNAFAAAISAVDSKAGSKTRAETNWRFKYDRHVVKAVELSARGGREAVSVASAGLQYCHKNFEFFRQGESLSLHKAMQDSKDSFFTGFIKGKLSKPEMNEITVPYKGKELKQEKLIDQVDRWVNYGTIEPSCGEYIKRVVKNKSWCDLRNKYFVLLGAGSAMGPLLTLLKLGANIVAIDLDRAGIWKRLISSAENSAGTITFPLSKPQKHCSGDEIFEYAGCNLSTHTPEIKNWLAGLYPKEDLIIGSYAYLDGAKHVQVSLAMDAIVDGVISCRPETSLAYLNTPTQVFMVPEETAKASIKNYNEICLVNILMIPLRLFGGKRFCNKNMQIGVESNYKNVEHIIDGLAISQGPNYALAKTIQHWRACLEKSKGRCVSSNVAPSTATVSVVSNRTFAWAYGGYHNFKPMEIFDQETSNAVMCALLINDINNKNSNSSPSTALSQPWDLFKDGAFHGGVWRQAYTIQSTGELAAVFYFIGKGKALFLMGIVVLLLAIVFSHM